MPDSLTWVTIGLGVAFALAGLHYYAWVFGLGNTLKGVQRIRLHGVMGRLRGQFSERDPADDVQQALNDSLNGITSFDEEPDGDLWIPEVRQPDRTRPPGQP